MIAIKIPSDPLILSAKHINAAIIPRENLVQ